MEYIIIINLSFVFILCNVTTRKIKITYVHIILLWGSGSVEIVRNYMQEFGG